MNTQLKKVFTVISIFGIILFYGCNKDDNGPAGTDSGTITLKYDGELMKFNVFNITVPTKAACEGTDKSECYTSIGGITDSEKYDVGLNIYAIEKGTYTCDNNFWGIMVLLRNKETQEKIYFPTSGVTCNLDLSTVNGLSLTEQGKPGKLTKMEGTFNHSSASDGNITEGHFEISK